MRYSKLFAKASKQAPSKAETINHKLLVQAGYVDQLMAGAYSYLPLGLRVLRKVEQVIREEMDAIGGQEVLMPILQPAKIWKQSGGWDSIDILFKLNSRTGKEYALGQSQEEVVTPLARRFVRSYADLPLSIYHIQWKYRDELRAKSGVMRGKEFGMKDMYSFHTSEKDFLRYYEEVKQAYLKIFQRLGLDAKVTEASGGDFTDKISYEFMILTKAGEDTILHCEECNYCVNKEIAEVKEGDLCLKCKKGKLREAKASEVGNVFDLGQKYAKDFDFTYVNQNGKECYPFMGCFGIGTTRLIGVLVEKFHDDKGILWPEEVAPFEYHLISSEGHSQKAKEVYEELVKVGKEVLWDDREEVSMGEKLAVADLLGMPKRLVVSERTGEKIEIKMRDSDKARLVLLSEL